jgi:hypothetical protein
MIMPIKTKQRERFNIFFYLHLHPNYSKTNSTEKIRNESNEVWRHQRGQAASYA